MAGRVAFMRSLFMTRDTRHEDRIYIDPRAGSGTAVARTVNAQRSSVRSRLRTARQTPWRPCFFGLDVGVGVATLHVTSARSSPTTALPSSCSTTTPDVSGPQSYDHAKIQRSIVQLPLQDNTTGPVEGAAPLLRSAAQTAQKSASTARRKVGLVVFVIDLPIRRLRG
jgi:hypothetical protein